MINKASEAFRTISEVSVELEVPPHVLRFWETKFPILRPLKRSGGRRYYRPNDILMIAKIRDLLYTEGFTIKGAQRFLKSKGFWVFALLVFPPLALLFGCAYNYNSNISVSGDSSPVNEGVSADWSRSGISLSAV